MRLGIGILEDDSNRFTGKHFEPVHVVDHLHRNRFHGDGPDPILRPQGFGKIVQRSQGGQSDRFGTGGIGQRQHDLPCRTGPFGIRRQMRQCLPKLFGADLVGPTHTLDRLVPIQTGRLDGAARSGLLRSGHAIGVPQPLQFDRLIDGRTGHSVHGLQREGGIEFGDPQLPCEFSLDEPPARLREVHAVTGRRNGGASSRETQGSVEIDGSASRTSRLGVDRVGESRDGQGMRDGCRGIVRIRWHRRHHDDPGVGPTTGEGRELPAEPGQMPIAPDRVHHAHAHDHRIDRRTVEPIGPRKRHGLGSRCGVMKNLDVRTQNGFQHTATTELGGESVTEHEHAIAGLDDRISDHRGDGAQEAQKCRKRVSHRTKDTRVGPRITGGWRGTPRCPGRHADRAGGSSRASRWHPRIRRRSPHRVR